LRFKSTIGARDQLSLKKATSDAQLDITVSLRDAHRSFLRGYMNSMGDEVCRKSSGREQTILLFVTCIHWGEIEKRNAYSLSMREREQKSKQLEREPG